MLAEAYARKSGKDAASFSAMMDAETWFTPAEAVAAGLANAVASEPASASAKWDLTVFANAPKAAAPLVTRKTTVTETTETSTETTVETETVEVLSGDPAMTPADAAQNEIEARKRQHAAAMLLKTA